MSHKANPTLIGLFTLVGLLLGAAALVLFGAGKFFEKTSDILLYFDRSANGLLVGSEVRFGGVRIGRVTSIKVLIDTKRNHKIIPVVVQLSAKDLASIGSTSGDAIDFASEEGVRKAVAEGLRARMKQQSLLTGKLYIEFDIAPTAPSFVYQPEVRPPFPMVPTIGAEMDELIAGIADGLKKFNSLDLASVMTELRDVLASTKSQIAALNVKDINTNLVGITTDVRTLVGNGKLTKAIDSLDEALTGIDEFTKKANHGIDPLLKDLEKVLQQANAGLAKIQEATTDVAKVTNPRAPVLMRLQNTLEETERAARAIKELANDLKQNPNSILLGKDHKP
jgi:paraquat-inducible protein B